MHNTGELQKSAEEIVRRTGEIARHYFTKITDEQIALKSDQTPVTVADLAINDFLVHELTALTPDIPIMSEETSSEELERSRVWIIDPIDGTKNFMNGNPYFGVSVGLVYDDAPEIGIVYAPVDDKLYSARRGAGAYLNGQPLKIEPRTSLSGATVLMDKSVRAPVFHEPLRELLHAAGAVTGNYKSASRELCSVAEGTADIMIHGSLSPWDIAGGTIIAREAGLSVLNLTGEEKDLFIPGILAVPPTLVQELLTLLRKGVGTKP